MCGLNLICGIMSGSDSLILHSKLNSVCSLTKTVGALPSLTVAMWLKRGEIDSEPMAVVQTWKHFHWLCMTSFVWRRISPFANCFTKMLTKSDYLLIPIVKQGLNELLNIGLFGITGSIPNDVRYTFLPIHICSGLKDIPMFRKKEKDAEVLNGLQFVRHFIWPIRTVLISS